MNIGVPKECRPYEYRVGLPPPAAIKKLSARLPIKMVQNVPSRCDYPFTLIVSNDICMGYPPPEG